MNTTEVRFIHGVDVNHNFCPISGVRRHCHYFKYFVWMVLNFKGISISTSAYPKRMLLPQRLKQRIW